MTSKDKEAYYSVYDSEKKQIYRNLEPWSQVLWIYPTHDEAEQAIMRLIDTYRGTDTRNVTRFAIIKMDISRTPEG